MTTSTSFPGPWTPGRHSNTAMFLQLRAQRPVVPKRSLSASEAPLTSSLGRYGSKMPAPSARSSLLQDWGHLGPRRIDISTSRSLQTWHAASSLAGVDWTARRSQTHQGTRRIGRAVTDTSSCYLLPNPGSKSADISSFVTDRTIACQGRHLSRWHRQGCRYRAFDPERQKSTAESPILW